MRLLYIISGIIFPISIVGCQTEPSATDRQIAKSLGDINKKTISINNELTAIRQVLNGTETPSSKTTINYAINAASILPRLKAIKLAKNPSRKQAEEYIKKIINASKGQKIFSSNAPQIAMLSKVGAQNVDLLIANSKNFYANRALLSVATEKNKKQILEAFKTHPQFITCILKKGWVDDAKITIFKHINNGSADPSPQAWILAAVQVASPKEYDILKKHFVRAGNPEMIFGTLSQLDGFDMRNAVAEGWERKKLASHGWSKAQMAIIAAKFGHKDALKYLIYAYRKESNKYMARQMQVAVYQLTGENISPKNMEKWYKKNHPTLVFDQENEAYILK